MLRGLSGDRGIVMETRSLLRSDYLCSHSFHILIIYSFLGVVIKSMADYGPESSPDCCMDSILGFRCVISHLQTDCPSGPQVPRPTTHRKN